MSKPRALVDNAADPEQVANAERVTKDAAKDLQSALEGIANTRDGEILFEWIVEQAAFFTTSFSSDALQMAHNEGRRTLGLMITAQWLQARPDAFAHLLTQRALKEKMSA